ncbi:MAG: glycine C-acetyltransferase [Propionicimonas sp.]|uniref:glycine C-acetyltransferase n=1 Tax=Propionicimonas sp. TaxID=1955623 RepID=UPI002B21C19D|nr:glycine C-acetyltransferase [Propionicimonas sp.]MEA4943358.1 glycine C-acetyltransferase [Propionicimonas sp.]MEA5119338.1 glycine C-acetyltransferase [Propionicimonas sp.]
MYDDAVRRDLAATLDEIRDAGLLKVERELTSPQSAHITTAAGPALNFCANNYLGLANHPDVVAAAGRGLAEWGFGMASVRFICGTQRQHVELEQRLSAFLGTEATILYSSAFDANGGVFEVLLDERDAVISDELNHASLIDGIRLCRAQRFRYRNADLADLEVQLKAATGARRRMIVTDGVFSMDGSLAPLPGICDLAEAYGALVLVDDSHAVGFVGEHGRGTPEALGVADRVDLYTGTLGKALGGACGGYVSGPAEVVVLLRQRSRPYLFSNSLAPAVVAGSLAALDLIAGQDEARERLRANTVLFRELMSQAGFDLLPGSHPITPVMFPGEDGARRATRIADHMLTHAGVYVIAFSFPVVPRGRARIRVQLSAAHTPEDVRACVAAFIAARAAVDAP